MSVESHPLYEGIARGDSYANKGLRIFTAINRERSGRRTIAREPRKSGIPPIVHPIPSNMMSARLSHSQLQTWRRRGPVRTKRQFANCHKNSPTPGPSTTVTNLRRPWPRMSTSSPLAQLGSVAVPTSRNITRDCSAGNSRKQYSHRWKQPCASFGPCLEPNHRRAPSTVSIPQSNVRNSDMCRYRRTEALARACQAGSAWSCAFSLTTRATGWTTGRIRRSSTQSACTIGSPTSILSPTAMAGSRGSTLISS
jgi:hypothetical protein